MAKAFSGIILCLGLAGCRFSAPQANAALAIHSMPPEAMGRHCLVQVKRPPDYSATYDGVVKEVHDDYIVLKNAKAQVLIERRDPISRTPRLPAPYLKRM